jgi:hypothetical protein
MNSSKNCRLKTMSIKTKVLMLALAILAMLPEVLAHVVAMKR